MNRGLGWVRANHRRLFKPHRARCSVLKSRVTEISLAPMEKAHRFVHHEPHRLRSCKYGHRRTYSALLSRMRCTFHRIVLNPIRAAFQKKKRDASAPRPGASRRTTGSTIKTEKNFNRLASMKACCRISAPAPRLNASGMNQCASQPHDRY